MNTIKVLLVDDHSVMRDGIRALLSLQNDIEVVGEASEGKEGIEKTRLLSPDVVVMDIAMPGMDGLEATRRITKRYLRTKVIIVTQFDNKEHMLSAMKAGGVGYVPKRSLSSELISAIRAVNRGDSFLPPPAAMALIEDYRQQSQSAGPPDQLTAMETEILKLVADGQTNHTIADRLAMTLRTVMRHRSRMMEKLGLKNRTELIKYAFRKGLASTN